MRSNRMYSQLTGMRRLKRLLDRSEVERGNKAQYGTKVNLAGYQLNRKIPDFIQIVGNFTLKFPMSPFESQNGETPDR